MRRICWLALACALHALPAAAGDQERLLPARPEAHAAPQVDGESLFTVRGRDCPASEFLALLVGTGEAAVIVDPLAEVPLKTTILTLDLHERRAEYIIELIAAASGVDVERDLDVYRVMGPPRPGAPRVRAGLRWSAERFYNMALLRQRDAAVTALTIRGLAELQRRSGDVKSAFASYETLLSRFPSAEAARDCELLLADCYMAVGDRVRAAQLLRAFLGKCGDSGVRDRALRRLLGLLIEESSLREIEDLREAFKKLDVISPETLERLADAASLLIEAGRAEAAVTLLHDLWLRDPQGNAVLAPVLALALVAQARPDPMSAATILRSSAGLFAEGAGPPAASALMAFAELELRAGRAAAGILLAGAALAAPDAGPAVRLRANLALGDAFQDLGLTLRARRHFYEAEQLGSPEEAAQLALRSAHMALEDGEPERARLLFQESLQHESVRHQAKMGIARALLAAGEPERARLVLARLAADGLPPGAREEVALLGVECLEALGDYQGARRLLNGESGALGAAEEKP
ncbi:MAG: tetratricopeptide repeat protein [Planctomycetes bacterium]|nr:tetratricopeptide repeat protein [Planctomycetota bacterium]